MSSNASRRNRKRKKRRRRARSSMPSRRVVSPSTPAKPSVPNSPQTSITPHPLTHPSAKAFANGCKAFNDEIHAGPFPPPLLQPRSHAMTSHPVPLYQRIGSFRQLMPSTHRRLPPLPRRHRLRIPSRARARRPRHQHERALRPQSNVFPSLSLPLPATSNHTAPHRTAPPTNTPRSPALRIPHPTPPLRHLRHLLLRSHRLPAHLLLPRRPGAHDGGHHSRPPYRF